jgi:WD40-like Beta Propeller Repeat
LARDELARPLLSVVCVGAVVLVAGDAVGGADARATSTQSSSLCRAAGGVAVWSPSGKRIAYVGRQQAICVAFADGTHARPLPYTVCDASCRRANPDNYPLQLAWVRPKLLLDLDDFQLFKVQFGQKPQLLGAVQGEIDSFSVDASRDRAAIGSSVCSNCRGPVTTLSVPTGRIIGQIGGPSSDNDSPSLSPNGTRLVFFATQPRIAVWTASADGTT